MFGSNDNQNQPSDAPAAPNNGISSFTMDPPQSNSTAPAPSGFPPEPTGSPTTDATTAPHVDESEPDTPAIKPHSSGMIDGASDDSASTLPATAEPPVTSDSTEDKDSSPTNDDLISIKQQALTQLSPIVQHLDQSPEEKFKTLMMMIQANDNQALIKDAYEAAEQISDEKAKSQALLDVVNEINYFTQKDK